MTVIKIKQKDKYANLITPNAFRRRFTKGERKDMRKSPVDDVQDVFEGLSFVPYIDVTHPYTIGDVQVLVDNGIITEARKTELLQPPSEAEKYERI